MPTNTRYYVYQFTFNGAAIREANFTEIRPVMIANVTEEATAWAIAKGENGNRGALGRRQLTIIVDSHGTVLGGFNGITAN